jgi:RimJ/RimL family protein N-acetyltransferase
MRCCGQNDRLSVLKSEKGFKMELNNTVTLKDGRACILRNGTAEDGQALLDVFNLTHEQTDFLLTYPEEHSYTAEQEAAFLQEKTDSTDEIELLAELDGKVVGSAGINCIGRKEKTRHRAEFGISVDKAYWGLGIGRALTKACIECAKRAGYVQLELEVVAENRSAIALYESVGFEEYGRNPKGFRSRFTGWQEVVLMRLAF